MFFTFKRWLEAEAYFRRRQALSPNYLYIFFIVQAISFSLFFIRFALFEIIPILY